MIRTLACNHRHGGSADSAGSNTTDFHGSNEVAVKLFSLRLS
jgi:hypothetical protein